VIHRTTSAGIPGVALALAIITVVAGSSVQAGTGDDGGRAPQPDNLLFSTFFGGDATEWVHAMDIDSNGSIYITGYTLSWDFPTTQDAYQRTRAGDADVYVAKLASNGSAVEWATLLGGEGEEMPWDIAVDNEGAVLVVGHTESADFPTTPSAYSRTLYDLRDAFVTRISPDGGSLEYSTLLGGEDFDKGYSILPLADRTALVGGHTNSRFFPTTSGAYDRDLDGGNDAFITRLSLDGSYIVASTYLGGRYTEFDPYIALDGQGRPVIIGSTVSDDFPTTPGAYDRSSNGARDMFATVLSRDLKDLVKSTLVGGAGNENPRSLTIGSAGEVVVSGLSNSPDLPTTQGSFSGVTDGMLLVLNSGLGKLEFSTFLGGSRFDAIRGAYYAPSGRMVLTGYTNSTDFPTTPDAYDGTKSRDDHDCFYAEADLRVGSLNYSTYIGGGNGDFGMDLAVDPYGLPVISGHTRSPNFPVSAEGADPTFNGAGDAFVLKFAREMDPPEFVDDMTGDGPATGEPFTFEVSVTDVTGVKGVWVEYWSDVVGPTNVTLEGEGTYGATITVDIDSSTLNYRFWAEDIVGSFNQTLVRRLTVRDVIDPWLVSDLTPDNGTTGDALLFGADVLDNIGIRSVHVLYSLGQGPEENGTMEMPGPLDHFIYEVNIPYDFLGQVSYRFSFRDGAGNWNGTPKRTIPTIDNDPPELGDPMALGDAIPGRTLTIEVTILENIGIAEAGFEYTFGLSTPVELSIPGPYGRVLSVTIDIPERESRDLTYTFVVEDVTGNIGSASGVVTIGDFNPPVIFDMEFGPAATTGDDFQVSFKSTDDGFIDFLYVTYWFEEGPEQTLQEPGQYSMVTSIPVPSNAVGTMNVTLGATDLGSNMNETGPFVFTVLDNDPPTANAGEDAEAIVGTAFILDGGQSTDNVGVDRYVWSYIMSGAFEQYEGRVLNLTFEDKGTFLITLTVYDAANNSARDTVTLTVVHEDGKNGDGAWSLSDPALAGVVIAIAAVVVILVMLIIRRRRGQT
jgi:hypothetical protein